MKLGQVRKAERMALNLLDEWNESTGAIPEGSSTYYEIEAMIEDAVHIGIQMAIFGNVKKDEYGEVIKRRFEDTPE